MQPKRDPHPMTKILYGVSPIGLGHASRAAAIGLELRRLGVEVGFASGGNACSFLRSYGFEVDDIVREPTPSESHGVMKRPGLWYLRYWRGYRSTRRRMERLFDGMGPALVVGDEEFSSVSLALDGGVKNVLISDELQLGFATGVFSRYIEGKVSAWYRALQTSVSHLLVPDFGEDAGNVHHVGPVVRAATMTREEVFSSLGLGPGTRMVLFSASGSGIGGFLLDAVIDSFKRLKPAGTVLVVTGIGQGPKTEGVLYRGVERDNQNFVAAADLVVSTAGKSTIDEAASHGVPIIAIPIKHHSEQEGNARSLGYSHDDILRMDSLIQDRLGRRTPPRDYRGAATAAGYIHGLL